MAMWNSYKSTGTVDEFFDSFFDFVSGVNAAKTHVLAGRLELDVPGVKRENINVERDGDNVVVSTVRGEVRRRGTYRVPLTHDINTLEASLQDGVLTLTVQPTVKQEKAKIKIEVK